MSKINALIRYGLIIRKISRNSVITLSNLEKYIKEELEFRGIDNIGTSPKTLRRDIEDIKTIFGIPIAFSYRLRGFHLEDDDEKASSEFLAESFEKLDLVHLMNRSSGLDKVVFTEKRDFRGSEHIPKLLDAIVKKQIVRFSYHKYGEEHAKGREVCPYALKEVRNRWYLLCIKVGQEQLKCFGLDRMDKVENTHDTFNPMDIDIEEIYKDCFGIYNYYELEPEDIVISFDEIAGRLTEAQPLHPTQESFVDETRPDRHFFRMRLKATDDFIDELMARDALEVHAPIGLREAIYYRHKKGMEQNRLDYE